MSQQNVERHTVQSSQCKSSSAPYVCAQDDDVFFEACTGRRAAVQTRESRSTFELSDVVDVDAFLDSSGEIQLQDVSTAGRRKTKYSTGTLIKVHFSFTMVAKPWFSPSPLLTCTVTLRANGLSKRATHLQTAGAHLTVITSEWEGATICEIAKRFWLENHLQSWLRSTGLLIFIAWTIYVPGWKERVSDT